MMRILQGTISYPQVKWGKPEDRACNTALSEFAAELADVGADGIELWGRHLDGLDASEIDGLARRIAQSGQRVEVLAPYWDFSSGDEAVKESLVDARRWLELKDRFWARKIRVFVGAPASAQATEDNWARAIGGLRQLAKIYGGSGVTFVIETHADQLADTVKSTVRLMKELDEPSILVNYQNMGGEPAAELDAVFQWVAHAHVSYTQKWKSNADEVVRELAKRGYSGTLTVEFCTDSLPGEGQSFDRAKAIAGMKRDVAHVRTLLR